MPKKTQKEGTQATGVKLVRTLEGHQSTITSLAFEPQGDILASGGHDRTGKALDTRSSKLLRTLEGHDNGITGLALDSQGETLASASFDGTLKLWEVPSAKLPHTLKGHKQGVSSLVFDPRSDAFATRLRKAMKRLSVPNAERKLRCRSWPSGSN